MSVAALAATDVARSAAAARLALLNVFMEMSLSGGGNYKRRQAMSKGANRGFVLRSFSQWLTRAKSDDPGARAGMSSRKVRVTHRQGP